MDDVNPERRAEYEAALAVLTPQITGLRSVANDQDLSQETRRRLQDEINNRSRRHSFLANALAELDECNSAHNALLDDGYPGLPKGVVTAQVLDELRARQEAVDAAVGQFDTVSVTIDLGNPTDKTKE